MIPYESPEKNIIFLKRFLIQKKSKVFDILVTKRFFLQNFGFVTTFRIFYDLFLNF